MSLPPALLKRLASRGLVKAGAAVDTSSESKADEILENEEIIAEDYDEIEYPSKYDSYEPTRRIEENFWIERMKLRIGEANLCGYKGCPNKYNIFHKCNLYCVTRWGNGVTEPDKGYLKRKARLMKKYSLPKGWKEVYDCGLGCFYYWNTANNNVSWLPPLHPKSTITKSAAVFRRQLEEIAPLGGDDTSENKMDSDGDSKSADQDETNVMQSQSVAMLYSSKNQSGNQFRNDSRSLHLMKKHRNRDLDKTIRQKEIRRYRNKIPLKKDDIRDPHQKSALPKQMREESFPFNANTSQ